jgi:glycosyltransferase involved in cell wall biosynthesis
MRLCFLAAADSIHSYRWIKYFADQGHEILWLSLSPLTAGPMIPGMHFTEIQHFPTRWLSLLSGLAQLRRILRSTEPDILHAHYAGTYGLIGALSGFHPYVTTAWGSDILIAGKTGIKRLLVKYTLSRSDLITCDAEHMRTAISSLGIDLEKVRLIYFGVDTEYFAPGEKNLSLARKLGLADSPVIISLRNLEPVYNVETLIRALPQVLRDFPIVELVIIGTGSQEDDLKRLVESLGVGEKVRFLGKVSNEDIVEYLRIADIYVSTSLSDAGIAASTAEAMACGLPVVITDSGENERWIKEGEGGFLIQVRDAESLAERIVYLLRNHKKRARFGEHNRKTIVEKNNYFKEMEAMEDLYKRLSRSREQD